MRKKLFECDPKEGVHLWLNRRKVCQCGKYDRHWMKI